MLVIALCTVAFAGLKSIKTWTPYFKIWPLYFECSGAGTDFLPLIYCLFEAIKQR